MIVCVHGNQVLDTNVVLNQMDLLDNPSQALSCIVVLQTVMEVSGRLTFGLAYPAV